MWSLYGDGFLMAFIQACAVYYSSALLLHFLVPSLFSVSSVQKGERSKGQLKREAITSLGPLAIKAGAWTVAEKMHASRIGLLYSGPVTTWPGICYLVMTIFALDYLHDSWFYWTHRLLHWAPIYRHVHYIHHRSSVPTAFTGYSFHILEAILVFANEVFICFLFPIHMGLHRVYHMFTTIIHNGGHAGYEIAPFVPSLESALYFLLGQIRLGHQTEALNTVMHHDMHHRFPKYHFSLYMTHWDRWMGTEHPNYRHQVLIKASGMSK